MTALHNAIKKVATGPHLSKDLSYDEAFSAMELILNGQADEVQAAIFLIALRMKRETEEENRALLDAMQKATRQVSVKRDQLLLLADPFNGFSRHSPMAAFLPAVLAASGLPSVTTGVYEMGPKFGITHAQVLEQAGVSVTLTPAQAAEQVNNTDIGWAYLDQSQSAPAVFALQDLRKRIIKRPSLATLEKLLMPLKATQTFVQTGFVHKAYPSVLAEMSSAQGFDRAVIVSGLEGGVIPTLRKPSDNYVMIDGECLSFSINPADFSIDQDTRGVRQETELDAKTAAADGLAALRGESGAAYDSLVLGAGMALLGCGLYQTAGEAAERVRQSIDNGSAYQHFARGQQ